MVSAKLIGIIVVSLIAIIAGYKVAKNLVKVIIVLALLVVGYVAYNAMANGKTLDTDKVKAVAEETVETGKSIAKNGKKALDSVNEFVQPMLKDKEN